HVTNPLLLLPFLHPLRDEFPVPLNTISGDLDEDAKSPPRVQAAPGLPDAAAMRIGSGNSIPRAGPTSSCEAGPGGASVSVRPATRRSFEVDRASVRQASPVPPGRH